ncbi:MAG: hypothetical protein HQL16_05490 [Candidatus Omnitrophica bacterium]|nr:hypothetical protein [Candidatus Omnitrophota bacterium]
MSLNKRSRDVMELREKLYGIPYARQYASVMKELPIERVPQHLHQTNDMLPPPPEVADIKEEAQKAAVDLARARASADALTVDIAQREEELKALDDSNADPQKLEQLRSVLSDKRNALLEKNLAMIEKKDRLDYLKNSLLTMNTDLKSADSRYLLVIEKIDRYYEDIKSDLTRKNNSDNKALSSLISDYAVKVRELEDLKMSVKTRDNELAKAKPVLVEQDKKIATIDSTIDNKDRLLAELTQKIAQYKEEIEQKDKTLKGADKRLDIVTAQAKDIDALLKESDAELASLSDGINKAKTRIAQEALSVTPAESGLREELKQKEALIRSLKSDYAELNEKFRLNEKEVLQQRNESLKDRHEKTSRQKCLTGKLSNTENRLTTAELAVNEKEEEILALNEKAAAREEEMSKLVSALDEKNKSAAEGEKFKAELATRDQQLSDLNKYLLQKDAQIAKLNDAIREFKDKVTQTGMLAVQKDNLSQELERLTKTLADQETVSKSQEIQSNVLYNMLQEQKKTLILENTAMKQGVGETRASLQAMELDLKEKDLALTQTKAVLAQKIAALTESDNTIKLLEEKFDALQNKQNAIKAIVDKRDTEIDRLEASLKMAKKDADNAKKDAAGLKMQAEQLREDLKTAHALVQKLNAEAEK